MENNGKYIVAEQAFCTNLIGGTTTELNMLLTSDLKNKFSLIPVIFNGSANGFNFFKAIRYYKKEFKKIHPDLVVIRGCEKEGLAAQIGARLAKTGPILVGCHGLYSKIIETSKIKHSIALHIIEPLIFKNCDYFYTVSESVFNQYKLFSKYRSKYAGVLYNACPDYPVSNKAKFKAKLISKLDIKSDSIIGIYHGRLTYDKGALTLIQALRNFYDTNSSSNFVFLFVGDGDKYKEIINNTFQKEIRNKQVFVFDSTKRIEEYLLGCDLYIHPSYHDNHSMSLLEACAAGCYIISTDVGGVRETVIPENSTIVGIGEFLEISKSISSFMQKYDSFDPTLWDKSKKILFSRARIYKEREKLYKKVIEKTKSK